MNKLSTWSSIYIHKACIRYLKLIKLFLRDSLGKRYAI